MSCKFALLLIVGVFVLQFSHILFCGEVIFPHENAVEVGLPVEKTESRIVNRSFSDESSVFIPELANNLRSDRKAWLATWNPSVQLGRASFHGILSRAFVLTNLLSVFSSNPFILYTSLALLTVILMAAFFLLFLRSLELNMVACVCAALGLAFTTSVSYWLGFVMFSSGICWLVCLLWLVTEFTRSPSWHVALGLVFATYCLLLSSYPQMTILSIYLIGPYVLIRVWRSPGTAREKLRQLLALAGCAAIGLMASLPVLLDLVGTARDSARAGDVNDSFFLAALASVHTLPGIASFLISLLDWSWLGNAIAPSYPMQFNGLSFTPIYGTLIWLSLFLKKRSDVLFWQVFLVLCLAGTLFPSVYLFAVHHLGFGLSRIQLAGGGIIPGFVLSAMTLSAVLRGELRLSLPLILWSLVPIFTELVVSLFVWHGKAIDLLAVAITVLLVTALLCSLRWRHAPSLIALAVASTFLYGRALILSQPLKAIHTSSKLIEAVKTCTPYGERFAIAGGGIAALPPNQEALLGLMSVNSYDSLSSRRYQDLTRHWSVRGTNTYGRNFKFLDATMVVADATFPLTNVSAILSLHPLMTNQLKLSGEVNRIKLYQPVAAPIDLLQTATFDMARPDAIVIDFSTNAPTLQSSHAQTLDDFEKLRVTATPQETVLFLSQQYHPAWKAETHHRSLRTVIVNDFYQGVILPPNTGEVELCFRPFVLWSWLPQLLFAIGGALLLLRTLLHIKPKVIVVQSE
jgi:hypothetical protein